MTTETPPQIGEVRRARELGRQGHARYQWHACLQCGTPRWVQYNHILAGRTLTCRQCAEEKRAADMKALKGPKSRNWRGGRYISESGHVRVWIDEKHPFAAMRQSNGYVSEHRLVMATSLNRCLTSEEIVHHKNGNKQDNSLVNLAITSQVEHMQTHYSGYENGFQEGYKSGSEERVRDLEQRIAELEKSLRSRQ